MTWLPQWYMISLKAMRLDCGIRCWGMKPGTHSTGCGLYYLREARLKRERRI